MAKKKHEPEKAAKEEEASLEPSVAEPER